MLRYQPHLSTRYETLGAVPSSTRGTTVTASASVNTKGSWTTIGTTTFEYHTLYVDLGNGGTADFVVDIGINNGSSVMTLCEDLRLCSLRGGAANGANYALPLYVPSGSALQARVASSVTVATLSVILRGASNGWQGAPGCRKVQAFYTSASSRGLDLDPGTDDTDTAWTEIDATTAYSAHGLMIGIGNGGESTRAALRTYLLDVGMGAAASEYLLISDLLLSQGSVADAVLPHVLGPFPCSIPASTRLAVRARTSAATALERKVDVALWGLI
jgi:hypothetical protein